MTTLAAIAGSLRRGSVNRLLPRCRPASTRLTDVVTLVARPLRQP